MCIRDSCHLALALMLISVVSEMQQLQVRRRLNEGDEGWLAPLVRTNPRSGLKSLHSPIWASRPRVRPAIEVQGVNRLRHRLSLAFAVARVVSALRGAEASLLAQG